MATRRWKARMNPPSPTEEASGPSPHIPAGPKKDYTLKEGQTFTINIPGRERKEKEKAAGGFDTLDLLGGGTSSGTTSASSSVTSSTGGGGAFPLLPPPPSAPKRR